MDRGRAAFFNLLQCPGGNFFWTAVLKEFGFQPWEVKRYAAHERLRGSFLLSVHLKSRALITKDYEFLRHSESLAPKIEARNLYRA
jgi:hypothetical protein